MILLSGKTVNRHFTDLYGFNGEHCKPLPHILEMQIRPKWKRRAANDLKKNRLRLDISPGSAKIVDKNHTKKVAFQK